MVEHDRDESLVVSDEVDNFSEVAADKSPSFLCQKVLVDLLLVAVYNYFGPALDLIQILSQHVPFMIVADDKGSTVDLILGKGGKIVETPVIDIVLGQLLLDTLKL